MARSHLRYQEVLQKTQIIWEGDEPAEGWTDVSQEFKVIKYLTSGGFSDIFLANDLKTGLENVILKRMQKSFYFKPERKNDAEKELAIMQRLPRHKNICQLYRFVQDKEFLYYILENCGSSDVWEYSYSIHKKTNGWLSEEEARRIYKQVLDGLEVLHNERIYHLDLTESNLFYNLDTNIVKIGDFGLSISTDEMVYPKFGTPAFFTPERQMHTVLRPSGVDIWYFGVGLFRITTGSNPFGWGDSEEALKCMKEGIYDVPAWISPELKDLFQKIFKLDSERITLSGLKNHPWFAKSS